MTKHTAIKCASSSLFSHHHHHHCQCCLPLSSSLLSLIPPPPYLNNNSHCTYLFIKFSVQYCILILCLPSHTTHALQPCDVGVFGVLAHTWKSQVTQASQSNIPITKDNLLHYYHKAWSTAFKPATIQAAFRKTGIHPLDHYAIPASAFKPAKNTTTKVAQCKGNLRCSDATKHVLAEGNPKLYWPDYRRL